MVASAWQAAPGIRPMKTAVIVAVLMVTVASMFACDETRSFTFANETGKSIVVTYSIVEKDDENVVQEENSYTLVPGQTVNTADDASLSGDSGYTIFNTSHALKVVALENGVAVFQKVLSFREVDNRGFRIAITEEQP